MRRLGFIALIALTVLIGTRPTLAGERPLTPRQAADEAAAAHAKHDEARLRDLASRPEPDPWVVADELCFRGVRAAAAALAPLSPGHSAKRLSAYVAAWRVHEDGEAARKALRLARRVLALRQARAALDALDDLPRPVSAVLSIRAARTRGAAQRALREHQASSEAFRAAADGAESIGWLAGAAAAYAESAASAESASDDRAALARWERVFALAERMGDRARQAQAARGCGTAYRHLGVYESALGWHERSRVLYEALGDKSGLASALGNLAIVHRQLGALDEALRLQKRALALHEAADDPAAVAATLGNIGVIHEAAGAYDEALAVQRRALAIQRATKDWSHAAVTLGNLGGLYQRLGDYDRAQAVLEQALEVHKALRDEAGMARARANLGRLHAHFGDYPRALDLLGEARQKAESLRRRADLAAVLTNIGILERRMGRHADALTTQRRALALYGSLQDRAGAAAVHINMGVLHQARGDYPDALESQQYALDLATALKNTSLRAAALGGMGNVYLRLGDYERALEYQQKSYDLNEEAREQGAMAACLTSMGGIHALLGEHATAKACLEEARRLHETRKDRAALAATLGNLAVLQQEQGALDEALRLQREALTLKEDLGDEVGATRTLLNLAVLQERRKAWKEAFDLLTRAQRDADRLGTTAVLVRARWGLARAHLAQGRPAQALPLARQAVTALGLLVGGQDEEHGASAREQFHGLFEVGLRSAVAAGNREEAAYHLESGRAGALLEALGGRDRLRAQALSPALRAAEEHARAAERKALALYAHTRKVGKLKQTRLRRRALDAARDALCAVIERIQRHAKAAADVLYPRAAPLAALEASLEAHDALVLYASTSAEAVALVVRQRGSRIVNLGASAVLADACRDLALYDTSVDPADALARLRSIVVTPLGLDGSVTRVLISPHGALCEVPFTTLLGARDVSYVPSGTTYRWLLESREEAGQGVLALGDPDYDKDADARSVALHRPGQRLPRLPAAADEAKAVGDVVLIGAQATEEGLRAALQGRTRWHAVHLACHGLVTPERPMLSSLALRASARSDGFLTCLDVFRMQIPADLVVLSACETARGRVYKAEGIVGLTRAFMFAGAPRVLCSLWKVDDKATSALMLKFYELWGGKGGEPGPGAAQALREAQAHVRAQSQWSHPYYWAAWVLWGLAD